MIKTISNRGGFTVLEILVATVIMLMILGSAMTVYLMSLTSWREGGVQVALQNEASIAMEKMVRGLGGRNGIREAKSFSIPDISTIEYTSGIDNVERSFYLDSNGQIIYDPDTSSGSDEFPIAENVGTSISGLPGLRFIASGLVINIDLNMEDRVRDRIINIDLSTQVKLRN